VKGVACSPLIACENAATEAYVTVLAGGRIDWKVGTAETVLNWFWVLTPALKLTELP
jgi:hypothetical protein